MTEDLITKYLPFLSNINSKLRTVSDNKIANNLISIFEQAKLYNHAYRILHIFDFSNKGFTLYLLKVEIDLGYKYDDEGQIYLGCIENYWLVYNEKKDYGAIDIIPNFGNRGIFFNSLRIKIDSLFTKSTNTAISSDFSIRFSDHQLIDSFLETNIPNIVFKNKLNLYIKCLHSNILVGYYSFNQETINDYNTLLIFIEEQCALSQSTN